jgi:hypothetical protein
MNPDTYEMSDLEIAVADIANALATEHAGDAYVIRRLLKDFRYAKQRLCEMPIVKPGGQSQPKIEVHVPPGEPSLELLKAALDGLAKAKPLDLLPRIRGRYIDALRSEGPMQRFGEDPKDYSTREAQLYVEFCDLLRGISVACEDSRLSDKMRAALRTFETTHPEPSKRQTLLALIETDPRRAVRSRVSAPNMIPPRLGNVTTIWVTEQGVRCTFEDDAGLGVTCGADEVYVEP